MAPVERAFASPVPAGVQGSFDDLGAPLLDATFCVLDLETTGGAPETCRITEVGAVKVRGGEVLGEFGTLVWPRVPIPPAVSLLTGITDGMVATAPPIESVLPAFLEFVGDAVLVAHNASFDTRFLAAALARLGYPPLDRPVICTVRLARRLVRDEVPNLRLATLAAALRSRTPPTHRALDDARATTDVFHALLERCGRWGVTHLDDLLWFQSARGHPSYGQLRLAERLPHARGVYLFRDGAGRVLYVGKATDLRSRVRSYIGDERRGMDTLLRELTSIDYLRCSTDLEASVLEARLIRRHAPPFNRAQRGGRARWFLRLTEEPFPRLVASRGPGPIGPLSPRAARALREALEDAAPIRTCTQRIGPATRFPACVRGQLGTCQAPCEGRIDPTGYAAAAAIVASALAGDPTEAIGALDARMERFAEQARFEDAATVRERIGAIVEAVRLARAIHALREAGAIRLAVGDDEITICEGVLAGVGGRAPSVDPDGHPDEPRLIATWLGRNAGRVVLRSCDGAYALPLAGGRILGSWRERLRRLRIADGGTGTSTGEPSAG